MVDTGLMKARRAVLCIAVAGLFVAGIRAAEAPRAPQNLGKAVEVDVPGPGANLVRNGSFEGSAKYAAQGGEWRIKRGREEVDGTTAAVGTYSLTKEIFPTGGEWRGHKLFDSGFQFAPFHCKWDRLYCISFYARADKSGVRLQSNVRGMHHSDNGKHGDYPGLMGERTLTTEWKRYHYFFPANRIKKGGSAANSYYITLGCKPTDVGQINRLWIDGLQVEEVEGYDPKIVAKMKKNEIPASVPNYPTAFKLFAPVEVCAESINLPKHNLYTEEKNVARVRAAIVNGDEARTVSVEWKLMDHRQREIWTSTRKTKPLQPTETWLPEQDVTLPQKGAMLVRTVVRNDKDAILNFSDEPVTLLPYDLSHIGHDFDERFGMNLSFADEDIPPEENQALGMFTRLGFRWVRTAHHGPKAVNFADKHGFNQFVSIFSYPESVRQGRFPHTLPKDQQWAFDDPKWDDLSIETEFDKMLRELATNYKGKVEAYQFGNETTQHDVKDPRIPWRVCRRAARVIRSIDPDVKLIGASIIYDWKISWWDEVMALGGLEDMDYFGWDWDCYITGGSTYGSIMKMREVMRKQSGGKEVPPFNYETGWGSGWMQDYPADPIGGSRLDYGVIPDNMARCFARIFSAGNRQFILHLAGYQENFMGSYWSFTRWPTQLYDEQERPRVTLAPYNVAVKFLGLSEPYARMARIDRDLEAYAFVEKREDRPVLVYWSTAETEKTRALTVPVALASMTAYDVMGNANKVARTDNGNWVLPLPANQEVVYLVGPPHGDPKAMLDGLASLPQIPMHIPTVGEEGAEAVDPAGGRWSILYTTQKALEEEATLPVIPTGEKGGHVWGGTKDDGRRVDLGGHGRANSSKEYGYAACLLFTPPEPGRYVVSASPKIHGGGGKSNEVQVVAGVLAPDNKVKVLGSIKRTNGDFPLKEILPGETVMLKAGERLLFSAWRTKNHWYGTAQFDDIRILKIED